jgi:sec-independent protein translocase protein TatA
LKKGRLFSPLKRKDIRVLNSQESVETSDQAQELERLE